MPAAASPPASPPARRRPGQAREDVLASARELFGRRGFDGASIREIATEAGTTQAMIYRHFEGKAELFEASVLAPLRGFMEAFMQEWRARSDRASAEEELFDEFVETLYGFVAEHRELFMAVIAATTFSRDALGDLTSPDTAVAPQFARWLGEEMAARGVEGVDVEIASRATIGMVVGTVLLEPWWFGSERGGGQGGSERVVKGLIAFQRDGLTGRAEA